VSRHVYRNVSRRVLIVLALLAAGALFVALAIVVDAGDAHSAADCTSLPLVGAHRGAPVAGSGNTENGLRSFRAAMANGADFIETDLRRARDHHLIVMHDAHLWRTTNLRGLVADKTLAQVLAGRLKDGEPIPNAATLFTYLRDTGVHVDLELKDLGPTAMSLLVKMLGSYHLAGQVHVTSTSTTQLARFQALTARYPAVFIAQAGSTVQLAQRFGDEVAWLNGPPIGDFLAAGMTVEAETQGYMVPGTAEWDAVMAYPVEAIDTDDVRGTIDYLAAACP
jgi:glycerophosphoryl diester phosphodiesterase